MQASGETYTACFGMVVAHMQAGKDLSQCESVTHARMWISSHAYVHTYGYICMHESYMTLDQVT